MNDSTWRKLVIEGFVRIPEFVEEAIEGLSAADLTWQPEDRANSIGWTVWHLIRVEDSETASLMGKEDLWIQEAWHAKFKRPADPEDTGYGHTEEQVKAFQSPDTQIYLDYLEAVTARTKQSLASLDTSELNRELDEPFTPRPTVGVRIVSVLADCHQHAGEALYIRGLLKSQT